MYNFGNPYGYQQTQMPQMQPRQEVVRVNGENGARAFMLPPSSNALLLDETSPVVFFVQTDGGGYKTITPYRLEPVKAEAPADAVKALEQRIKRIEDMMNESDYRPDAEAYKSDKQDHASEAASSKSRSAKSL